MKLISFLRNGKKDTVSTVEYYLDDVMFGVPPNFQNFFAEGIKLTNIIKKSILLKNSMTTAPAAEIYKLGIISVS